MDSWILIEAAVLALRTDAMLVVAAVCVLGAHAAGAALHQRSLEPHLRWREALVSGAHEQVDEVKSGITWIPATRESRLSPALFMAALLGLLGAIALALSGHPPTPALALIPAALAAFFVAHTAVRIVRTAAIRSQLSNRFLRLMASSLCTEISSALALLITVSVVLHTAGLSFISLLEVAAITFAVRFAVRLTPRPAGLGVADVVLLIPLTWIGVPLHVGLASLFIWRVGTLLALLIAFVIARTTHVEVHGVGATPSHSDRYRLLHRALFFTLSLLPGSFRESVRARVFDSMFTLSDDPWGYHVLAYEQRKREHLLAAIAPDASVVLEVGCADGHNLVSLARLRPNLTILGVDISDKAVSVARARTNEFSNVFVLNKDQLTGYPTRIDCVILSEVLYYLGTERAIRTALEPLIGLMTPTCRVVMLHGSVDAAVLHGKAAHALELPIIKTEVVDDPERPFVLAVAHAGR